MGAIHQALLAIGAAAGGGATPVVGRVLLFGNIGSGTQSITGAGFSPDLVAFKARAALLGWRWVDNVRGAGLAIASDATAAELTETTGLVSFDADGFTSGVDTQYNSNFNLALVLQMVAGAFDIVAYTGTGVAHTIAHGLGVVPEFIIVKDRSATGNWIVYPGPLSSPETKFLLLNTTAAVATSATAWNNTLPTSSVFTVGTSTNMNTNGNDYIAYLFASLNPGVKVGSYTGDGNINGPVVTTGFRPRLILIKRIDATSSWYLFDDQRDPSSPHNTYSNPHLNNAETVTTNTAGGVDFLATGFQSIDEAPAALNVSGATYIYLAIT